MNHYRNVSRMCCKTNVRLAIYVRIKAYIIEQQLKISTEIDEKILNYIFLKFLLKYIR